MTSTPDQSDQPDLARLEGFDDDAKESAGVELGLSDEPNSFEPEEDPEAT